MEEGIEVVGDVDSGDGGEVAEIGLATCDCDCDCTTSDDGVGTALGDGSGSLGSSRDVSGVCTPTGFRGRRIVPLLGFGTIFRESQTML